MRVSPERVALRWLEARKVNRTDPGALLSLLSRLLKRDDPKALPAVKSLSRAIQGAWGDREELEGKAPQHPRLNKERANSVVDYLYWLVVVKNQLEEVGPAFQAFRRALDS